MENLNSREKFCIKCLGDVLSKHYPKFRYCLNDRNCGEMAVCMYKDNKMYRVFYKERNIEEDVASFDNVIEASIEVIRRLSGIDSPDELLEEYFSLIVPQKILC